MHIQLLSTLHSSANLGVEGLVMPKYPTLYANLIDTLLIFGLIISLASLYIVLSKFRVVTRIILLLSIIAFVYVLAGATYLEFGYLLEYVNMYEVWQFRVGPLPLYFMLISIIGSLGYLLLKRPARARRSWLITLLVAQLAVSCLIWAVNNLAFQEMWR